MTSIALQMKTNPRGYVVEPDGTDARGKRRFRARIENLAVGDTLAGFGKVLKWEEVEPEGGYRMFHMVTEHPQHYPVETNEFVRPAYVYYGIVALAEPAPKLSPAQERSLLSGLANTKTRVLEGRPVTNRSLVNLGYAYHAPTFMQYKLTEAGIARATELRDAQRAEQFNKDAAAVEDFRPTGSRPLYARDVQVGMRIWDGAFGFREVTSVQSFEEGPHTATHWTRIGLGPAVPSEGKNFGATNRTSNPDHIWFVDEAEEAPQP
ncbi:hypothetical protein [Streptomyces sp. NPDC059468]|uniref:hypothetical protein n=1 Tax=Streptomyces sp. NPDC059468 TaxID=3346845 RepID=UPI0036BDF85C